MDQTVQTSISLSQYTTYKTGGPAKFFGQAKTWEDIHYFREFARREKVLFLMLGGGSNILFPDEGYPGMVVLNQMRQIHFQQDTVTAESGVNMAQLVMLAAQKNLGGISGLANVPGSIGGAVYGNAGIPDIWINHVLLHATILPHKGSNPIMVGPDYCQFGYRTSYFKQSKDIILSATLQLTPMPSIMIRTEVNQYIRDRSAKQPMGLSCGSFFKNPSEFPSAGWLIEQSGCKGMMVGGAQVSEKHANFVLNTGHATTADILNLAMSVHAKVKEKFGISLQPEVQIVPESPFGKQG